MSLARPSQRAVALGLLAAVVIGGALLRGGVWWPVQAVTAVACAAALALATRRQGGRRRRGGERDGEPVGARLQPLPIGLAAGTGLVALQLVPLPPALLAFLSPAGAELQASALEPIGLFPAWRPLSLDPGATGQELTKLATWTLAAAAVGALARKRERRDALLKAIAAAGSAVALACYGGALAGLGSLTQSRVTFVNPNHLSAFMLLTCWIALGLGLRSREGGRIAWLSAFVITSSQVFLSLSRAGIAAFFVGAGVATVLAIRTGRAARAVEGLGGAGPARLARAVAAPMAVFATLAVSAWLALDRVVGQLRTLGEIDTEVKLSLWPLAVEALKEFPLTGMGRGAFATVFSGFKVEPAQVTFTHLENTWLQVPLDVGLPAGLAFLALCAWTWLSGARVRDLSRPMIGALAGVAAVAAHDVFDFSLELSGVAIPFLAILVLASSEARAITVPRWAMQAAAAVLLALAGLGLALHLPHRADPQAARIMAAETLSEASAATATALLWHPADWVPPATMGYRLVTEGRCAEAMAWLNRAMLRNPTAPEPHRAAGRCLAASGQDAAAKREFRLAFAYGDASVLEEALDTYPAAGALLEIVPDTPSGLLAAGRLLQARVPENPEEAHEAYRRAWESFRSPQALAGLAQATADMGEPEQALELARLLQQEDPSDAIGYRVAARAMVQLDRTDDAVKELEKGAALLPRRSELLFDLGNLHIAEQRFSQAKLVFERVIAREGREQAQKRLGIARALERQGRYGEALAEARAAQESLPGEPWPLLGVARIAAKAGLFDVAIDAVERAARMPQSVPGAYEDQLADLRKARTTQRTRGTDRPQPASGAAP